MEMATEAQRAGANSTVPMVRREVLRWRRSPTEKTFGGRRADVGVSGKRRGDNGWGLRRNEEGAKGNVTLTLVGVERARSAGGGADA